MKGYIEIRADRFLYWYSKFTGTQGKSKMGAFYPFLFVTTKVPEKMKPFFINHELIHFEQQKEMGIIGFWIYVVVEMLYVRIIKNKRGMDAYCHYSFEQEAYDNMFNLNYNKERKRYSHIKKYWKRKSVNQEEYLARVSDILTEK